MTDPIQKAHPWRGSGPARSAAAWVAGAFAILLLVASTGALARTPDGTASGAKGTPIADQADLLIEEITGDEAGLAPVSKLEEREYSDDVADQARLFATRVLNHQIQMRNDYMSELQAIGWDRVLDPVRLAADSDMSESVRIVALARAAADRMCTQMRPKSEAAARAAAAELNVTERQRRRLVAGFLEGMDKVSATTDELCRLEIAILDEIGSVVAVFGLDPDWYQDGDELVFSDDRFVEAFNTRMQNVLALSETQTALQKKAMTEASAKIRSAGL